MAINLSHMNNWLILLESNKELLLVKFLQPLVKFRFGNFRNKIGNYRRVSTQEVLEGRPLLSELVLLAEIGYSGKGFFNFECDFGLHKSGNDLGFFVSEYLSHICNFTKIENSII